MDWPEGGVPSLPSDGASSLIAERVRDAADLRRLLACMHEFDSRGEWVSTSPSSPRNPVRLLSAEPGYPKHRRTNQVFDLLRSAERERLIERSAIRTADRKVREAWKLAHAGLVYIGAPTAPTAPTYEDGAGGAGCANRANPPPIGGGWRAQVGVPGVGL